MNSKFSSKIFIRPSDIDINGHVHHSHYFDFLLAARMDHMRDFYKMPMEEFVERGWGWMVRRYEIEYKRSLKLGDFATVTTWVMAMGSEKDRRAESIARIGFELTINDTGKVSAYGHANYVMVDIKTGRAVKIPQDVIERYSV